ncbi:MAG: flagellar hook-associated protein FlgK [Bacillota bacterium]|nr:flagellar hook-associated protein FlgK [Bacillota bacterium]
MSSFMGLEIGKRSIMTNQTALNITGHNISNANTPGYTRQVAQLTTNQPWHTPTLISAGGAGQLGTGVDLKTIERMRDEFLDGQIRHENRTSGYWDSMQQSLARIEVVLNEPSEDGLRSVMDQFWQSWQDLAANPESEAVRSVVAQRGLAVADVFNHTYRQLSDLREDVNASVKIQVDEINSIALQLKDLNQQILAISIAGKQPNDLSDRRDLLLDQLSTVADISVFNDQNGMVAVQLGGRTLVQGVEYTSLTTTQDRQGMHMVVWEDNEIKAQINGGELAGLLDARGQTLLEQESDPSEYKEVIPTLISQLNAMAKTIAMKTNEVHREGFSLNNRSTVADHTNFFTMPDVVTGDRMVEWAEFIQVNSSIYNDPKNIAAAAEPTWDAQGNEVNFGDGANALLMAQLKHDLNSEDAQVQTTSIALPADDFSFDVSYGSRSYTINITSQVSWADLQTAIQTKLDTQFGGVFSVVVSPETAGAADKASLKISCGNRNFEGINNFINDSENYHVMRVQDVTTDDFWRSLAAEVGVQSQEAERMVENQDVLLNQLENKRQSISGVSLDEEMTNMIKYQHAYSAASRYITVIDEAIDQIINRTGTVGR